MSETPKIEGTIALDGLIEGKLSRQPDDEGDIEQKLEQWVAFAKQAGLGFHLQTDGNAFNLMPGTEPVSVQAVGQPPDHAIQQLLEQLVGVLPEESQAQIFSTLRSIEYRPGEAVQTLYTVDNQGQVDTQQRTVDETTTPAPQPISRREIVRMSITGLVAAVLIVGVTSIFVDLPGLFSQMVGAVTPLNPEKVEVTAEPFAQYIEITDRTVDNSQLIITLKRKQAFPVTDEAINTAAEDENASLQHRLALEAIARGYVRCETFNTDGEFLGYSVHRIAPLRDEEQLKLALPLPDRQRLGRVNITY